MDSKFRIVVYASSDTSTSARGCEMLVAHVHTHGRQPFIVIESAGLDRYLASLLEIEQLDLPYLSDNRMAPAAESPSLHPVEVPPR